MRKFWIALVIVLLVAGASVGIYYLVNPDKPKAAGSGGKTIASGARPGATQAEIESAKKATQGRG